MLTRSKVIAGSVITIIIALVVAGFLYFDSNEKKIIQAAGNQPSSEVSTAPSSGSTTSPSESSDKPNPSNSDDSSSAPGSPSGSNAPTDSINLTNLTAPTDAAPGNPEENYESGKELRNQGDVAEAIRYFRSAITSDDLDVSVAAQSSLAQLEYLAQNTQSKLPVENADNYTEGKTAITQDGKFEQGSVSLDVKTGDTVEVVKEPYQVSIITTAQNGERSYYGIVTR